MEALELPRLFQRELWTQPKVKKLQLPGYNTNTGFNQGCSYYKEIKGANIIEIILAALGSLFVNCFMSGWTSLYRGL